MDQFPLLIVIGYTNIDINITPSKKTIHPGGGAYFAALVASRLLQPVGLVTRIGRDFDPTLLLSHILPDGVHIIHDKPTARSTAIYRSDTDLTDRTFTLDWGVAPDICPEDIPSSWLPHAQNIHIATMPPKQQAMFISFLRLHAPKAILSLDSDQFLYTKENMTDLKKNFKNCDIIFANRQEYRLMKDVFDLHSCAIIKQDKDGAFCIQNGNIIAQTSAPTVSVVDVTGAGDIFAGTFLSSRILGQSIQQSLQIATKVASEAVTKEGILHLFPNWGVPNILRTYSEKTRTKIWVIKSDHVQKSTNPDKGRNPFKN